MTVKVQKLPPGEERDDMRFQQYAHDKQLGVSNQKKYWNGPLTDNTITGRIERRLDAEKLRANLRKAAEDNNGLA